MEAFDLQAQREALERLQDELREHVAEAAALADQIAALQAENRPGARGIGETPRSGHRVRRRKDTDVKSAGGPSNRVVLTDPM